MEVQKNSPNAHLLRTPVKKSRTVFKRKYPFPIIRSECNEGEPDLEWKCVEGFLEEDCVLVHDDESIKLLYTQGFYGKGTLSKNAPKICLEDSDEEIEVNQPSSSNKTVEDDIIDVLDDDDEDTSRGAKQLKVEADIEVVLSDSNDSNTKLTSKSKEICSQKELSNEKESLQLSLVEAYFLSYALGCLVVKDNRNQPIDLARLWNKFCEATEDGNFPVIYTAYHHFRSKGWIVKSGLKYGVDYVLYKDGPPFYHATYSVIVKPVKEQNLREGSNSRQMTWAELFALNRLNSGTSKDLMFLYVIKPSTISENKISTPFCVSQYKLEEVLFKRWVASENRDGTDLPSTS